MNIAQRVEKAVLLIALALLPVSVPAQTFHLVSQQGYAAASAFVSGPEGSPSDSEQNPAPGTGPIDVFADASVSLEGMSASAIARLTASFDPTVMTITGSVDSNGSVSNTIEQSAGATAGVSLQTVFTVDVPTLLSLTGESHRSLSGDGSVISVDTGIVLRSGTTTLTDLSGIDGTFEFQGLLEPGKTYTLITSGIANSMTSQDFSFASTSGSLSLTMTAAPIPAPGALLTALIGSVPGATLLLRRRQVRA